MKQHVRSVILLAMAVVISACATDEADPGEVATTVPPTTLAQDEPAPATTSTVPEETDSQAVEDYLVALANLEADLGDRLSSNEEQCNEKLQGEEEPTEEELLELGNCFLTGIIEGASGHAAALAALTAPAGFEPAHTEYVIAVQAWADQMRADSSSLETVDQISAYLGMVFFGFELTPGFESIIVAVAAGCAALEQMGIEAGYSSGLGCPQEPMEAAEPVELHVQVGGPWVADPNPLPATEGELRITLTNVGDQTIQPVMIDVFDGDPTNLPVVNGVVDLSLSGTTDPSSPYSSFGVQYPDVFSSGDSNVGEVATLAPGETAEILLFGSAVFVVFDYRAGEFEAGSYVVIETS